MRRSLSASLALIALSGVGACSRTAQPPKVPLGQAQTAAPQAENAVRAALPVEARAALDSGNSAFRAKQYTVALDQYRVAAKAAPKDAAPYYGIYMAAKKLGNDRLADSATAEIAKRSDATSPMLTDSALKAAHTSGAKGPKAGAQ